MAMTLFGCSSKSLLYFWSWLRTPAFLFACFAPKAWCSSGSPHLMGAVPVLTSPPFSPGTATRDFMGPQCYGQPCCNTEADVPSCCFIPSVLGGVITDKARGAAWLFSTRLCPRSALWLELRPASLPLQSLSIQTTAFMSVDSFFCFPNKANRENDYFISSVTQIRRDILFFFHFPHRYFLPLSSCWHGHISFQKGEGLTGKLPKLHQVS